MEHISRLSHYKQILFQREIDEVMSQRFNVDKVSKIVKNLHSFETLESNVASIIVRDTWFTGYHADM